MAIERPIEMPEDSSSLASGARPASGAQPSRTQGQAGAPSHDGPATHHPHANGHADYSSLAVALEPALIAACDGDLSGIEWFRSTWQAGGAATARARFALTEGRWADVIVKLPVGPAEYLWTRGMEGLDAPEGAYCELEHGCTPRVFAAGTELGGYDLAWLVVERIPGHPLSHSLDERAVHDLLGAAVEWYQRAAALRTPPASAPTRDWAALLDKARHALRDAHLDSHQRWADAVRQTQKSLNSVLARWEARPINTWCHGDLHPGNAMRRPPAPGQDGPGRCVLIDLALVHPGHWVEDAVYLERLFWGRPELLHGVRPVTAMARLLKERGLHGGEDHTAIANFRRVLMAATAPAFLAREGNPRYLAAALDMLERTLTLIR
jgi:hypothetical protein